MLQALTTLLFASLSIVAVGTIALLLRNDWDAVCAALGIARRVEQPSPRPPHVRIKPARRAVMVRMEAPQRRAAA